MAGGSEGGRLPLSSRVQDWTGQDRTATTGTAAAAAGGRRKAKGRGSAGVELGWRGRRGCRCVVREGERRRERRVAAAATWGGGGRNGGGLGAGTYIFISSIHV